MAKLTFPFTKIKTAEGSFFDEPKIPVTFFTEKASIDTNAILDTGSTISHIPRDIAEALGFDEKLAEKEFTCGIAGEQRVANFQAKLKISRKGRGITINNFPLLVFLDDTDFCLLGLRPLFLHCNVEFRMLDGKIEITEHNKQVLYK